MCGSSQWNALILSHKIWVIFVDSIVGEMLVEMREVFFRGLFELLSGKPGQPIPIKIEPEWLQVGNENENPHIKLQPIDKFGFGNIFLYNDSCEFALNAGQSVDEKNAFALRAVVGLYDIKLILGRLFWMGGDREAPGEEEMVCRQDEGVGVEGVLLGEVPLHTVKKMSQLVFPGQQRDVGQVIDPSIWRLLPDLSNAQCLICPIHCISTIALAISHLFCNFPHYLILCVYTFMLLYFLSLSLFLMFLLKVRCDDEFYSLSYTILCSMHNLRHCFFYSI